MLLYAYCTGTYSSRKIAAKLADSVGFRFLAAGNRPDFRTTSEFRRRHGEAVATLFTQGPRLCRKAGLAKLGGAAIDSTRIETNASMPKVMSYGRMKQAEAGLEREVAALLRRVLVGSQSPGAGGQGDRAVHRRAAPVAWCAGG